MKRWNRSPSKGFTMIELLLAMTVAALIIGCVGLTFKSQHGSALLQEQVTVMQQNLRAAMFVMSRDIQMAGFYTHLETTPHTMDWDALGGREAARPLIYARNNVDDPDDGVRDRSDVIVVAKASDDGGRLGPGETAGGGRVFLTDLDLDDDGDDDFDFPGRRFGLLVTADLNGADFFEISGITGTTLGLTRALSGNYGGGDYIFRTDILIYRVTDAANPGLVRRNLGADNHFQLVAENIDQLQLRYLLDDGANPPEWTDDPAGREGNIRAVQIFLLARTARPVKGYRDVNVYDMADAGYPRGSPPNDPFRRKLLSSLVRTRNIGMGP